MNQPIETNPYAVPRVLFEREAHRSHDRFILEQVKPLLETSEHVMFTAFLVETPSLVRMALALVASGSVLATLGLCVLPRSLFDVAPMITMPLLGMAASVPIVVPAMLHFVRPFLVAVTPRRMFLIRTSMGAIRPAIANRGISELHWDRVSRIDVGGMASNRSLSFVSDDGAVRTMRLSPWTKFVSGQAEFFAWARRYLRNA